MNALNNVVLMSIFLLFLSTFSQAQEISEADVYFVSAQRYLGLEDHKNALRSAQLARMIYENLSNMNAVGKCDTLIKEISTGITQSMKADDYYGIAEDFFFEAEKDPAIETYEKTIYFANLAKKEYLDIGDRESIQRSEDIIIRAQSEINEYFSSERLKAYTYYNLGRAQFIEERYLTAISFIENASAIYSLIEDAEGMERCRTITNNIHEKIEEVKINAQAVCDTAMELYNDGNMSEEDGAEFYASKCKSLYKSVNYGLGVLRADDLLTLIHQFTEHSIDRRKKEAARLFKDAEEAFVRKQYANATESVKQTREIYAGLYYQTDPDEEDTRKYYSDFLGECDRLYARISNEWGGDRKLDQAEQFFTQAQKYYIDQFFDESLTYAKRAKNLFEDLQNYVGVSKTNSLIKSIAERVSRELMGDGNLSQGYGFLTVADFENALVRADRAKKIYETLIGSDKNLLADELLAKINVSIAKKEEASGFYNYAYEQFNSGNFVSAEEAATSAHNLYNEINHSIGIAESKNLLDQASDKVSEEKAKKRTLILIVVIVIIVLAIMILNYSKKKKAMEEAARIAAEERMKQQEMEKKKWAVEKEVEAKHMAEEKFKDMIAEERDLVDEKPPLTSGGGKKPPDSREEELEEDLI